MEANKKSPYQEKERQNPKNQENTELTNQEPKNPKNQKNKENPHHSSIENIITWLFIISSDCHYCLLYYNK